MYQGLTPLAVATAAPAIDDRAGVAHQGGHQAEGTFGTHGQAIGGQGHRSDRHTAEFADALERSRGRALLGEEAGGGAGTESFDDLAEGVGPQCLTGAGGIHQGQFIEAVGQSQAGEGAVAAGQGGQGLGMELNWTRFQASRRLSSAPMALERRWMPSAAGGSS